MAKLTNLRVTNIGPLEQIRRVNKGDIFKQTIDFEHPESDQKLYCEIRNSGLKVLDREGIEIGSIVDITIEFQGSEKFDRKYNNLIITDIKLSL